MDYLVKAAELVETFSDMAGPLNTALRMAAQDEDMAVADAATQLLGRKRYDVPDQSDGLRRAVSKSVRRKLNRFNWKKLANSDVSFQRQQLGVLKNDSVWKWKYPVSEFNPGTGGLNIIAQNSEFNHAPMHIYDLNYLQCQDSLDFYNKEAQLVEGRCSDIGARSWVWHNTNYWSADMPFWDYTLNRPSLGGAYSGAPIQHRYYVDNPRGNPLPYRIQTNNVYRKRLDIRFMMYGCKKMPVEYDVRVIKILDPNMCPDCDRPLASAADTVVDNALLQSRKAFQQNWQNLIRAWSINPILRGVDPGPKATKRWFKTVAKKRIIVGEQTGDLETIPCVQGSIKVDLNSLTKYHWTDRNITVDSGDAAYDNVPGVEDAPDMENNNTMDRWQRPYYTSRYYLLIRAISPVDCGHTAADGQDVEVHGDVELNPDAEWKYTPSYDLVVRTEFLTKTGQTY